MSFHLRSLVDSLTSYFSGRPNPAASLERQGQPPPFDRKMEGVLPAVPNERVANKLKGYFDLAKEEIDKAVRAEEWGLADDAVVHYNNARSILSEAKSARASSFVSSSEQEKVNSYYQKILKWEGHVLDRLQVLGQRSGIGGIFNDYIINASGYTSPRTKSIPKSRGLEKPVYAASSVAPPKAVNATRRSKMIPIGRSQSNQEEISSYDDKLVEMINSAIIDRSPAIKWDDVAGLDQAKQALLEMVILPTKRRDLFTGLRRPARGLLLFGPPGNGKTMLAKAVASESEATFFNISASSLTSKWVGEAEKLMKTLFSVAIARQPSVIFIDEIDSIMSAREANENEASRRLKSEFLVQFDGVASNSNDLVIVIGKISNSTLSDMNSRLQCSLAFCLIAIIYSQISATNKPQELDDAVLRRLVRVAITTLPALVSLDDLIAYYGQVKRIYVPLPDERVRRLLLKHQLKGQAFSLPDHEIERLVRETEGYSGSDLQALCEEAALMPIRELGPQILHIKANQVRPLRYEDFQQAMAVIRPSTVKHKWEELERWNKEFGSR
ncbi:Spastin [Nymphaea thermarum]|nr:Spastin [Nymphaea thermarum]